MMENPKLTNDIVFSFLMASSDSEPALQSFINATLTDVGRPLIKSVTIHSPFTLNTLQSGKVGVLDVKAQGQDGRYFDIEMQTTNKKGFNNRILFYWSRLYSQQLSEGDNYTLLNPVVSIIVAQFVMFPKLENMHNVFTLTSESNPKVVFSDQMQIHSIELPKANFTNSSSVQTKFSQWVDFFQNGHEKTEAEMNDLLSDEGLALAIKKYRALCQDPTLRELALRQEKAERDRQAELEYALDEGMAKGMEKGMAQGLEKGLAQGREEGREQGLEQGREEGLAKGVEKGRAEGLKNTIARRYSKQYPDSDSSKIQQVLEPITDEKRLNDILDIILDSETEAEFFAKVEKTL